jgi:hypothetical protein
MILSFDNGEAVRADLDSPDRILSKKEPRHKNDIDTDPDLDFDDDTEALDLAGIKDIPRDALKQLLLFLIPKTTDRGSRWKMATVRLAIVARILDIDEAGRVPLETLAKQIGVTRSLLSLRQLEIADQFELGKLRSSKSAAARQSYSVSATEAHRKAQERRQIASGTHIHQTTVKPT